jgi:serine phosphatase RsbU (regulator of sigma subunit)
MQHKTLLFILLLFSNHVVLGQEIIMLENSKYGVNIAKSITVFEDKNANFRIEQILQPENQHLFKPNDKEVISFGSSRSVFWFRFQVQNKTTEEYGLEIERGTIDSVFLYEVSNLTNVKKNGNMLSKENRDYDINYPIFNLNAPKDSLKTYYLRVASNKTIIVPTLIASKAVLLQRYGEKNIGQGIYFGCLLFVGLYNLFIFFSIKEKYYLYYVLYVVFVITLIAVQGGFVYQYFTYNFLLFNQYSTIIYLLSLILYLVFSIQFLDLHKFKILKNIHLSLLGIYVILFLLFVAFAVPPFAVNALRLCVLAHTITTFSTAIYRFRLGYKPAKYFMISCSGLFLSVIVTSFRDFGLFPPNFFTNNIFQIGSAWEMLFLSFALADKINQLQAEKRQAEALILQATSENAKLVQEQNKMLEQRVQERTTQLQAAYSEIEVQNEELRQQQEELLTTNEALEKQKLQIHEQKEQLETTFLALKRTSDRLDSSIRYAKQIQEVILPENDSLTAFFADFFAIYLPKDIVSGDFYWFKKLPNKQQVEKISESDKKMLASIKQKINFDFEDDLLDLNEETKQAAVIERAIFIAADCTGHGVPGAFMTMIGNTLLHEIIINSNTTEPAKILKMLNASIINVLRQDEGKNTDGIDISVVLFEQNKQQETVTLHFAAAKSTIFYSKDGEIVKISGNRSFLGGTTDKNKDFKTQIVHLKKGERVYFATDGFADQNNTARESFSLVKFKNLLQEVHKQALKSQRETILAALQNHQQTETQRDDITVVGLLL